MTIGIDVGGGSIKGALLDEEGQIIRRGSRKNDTQYSNEQMIGAMAELILELAAGEQVDAVGIGMPGTVDDEAGTVPYANNIRFENVDLRGKLLELTGYSVRLVNDANAAAFAEAEIGAARGAQSVIVVTLGTGVGGGVILDGKLLTGYTGAASELGHMVVRKDGEPCTCGRRGCFETVASATALVRQTKRAMEAHPESLMNRLAEKDGRVSGRTAFEAADAGDAAAAAVVDEYLDGLALGLANLINIFFPEVIALSGGIANRGESLIRELEKRVYPQTYGIGHAPRRTRLSICSLGYESGMIGAALYAKSVTR